LDQPEEVGELLVLALALRLLEQMLEQIKEPELAQHELGLQVTRQLQRRQWSAAHPT